MTKNDDFVGAAVSPPLVSARHISKSFGGARALEDVSLEIAPGEVHGLVGANGAGKSTLIKVLAGLVRPDGGELRIDGQPVTVNSPHRATELGLSFIHQELAFIPEMNVLENIMLGVPKKMRLGMVDWGAIAKEVAPIAERVGISAPLNARVAGLSTAENWLINICRALVRKARLIVMDEPTASLSASEAEKLFAIIKDLSASGIAVLYVSHRLDEIMQLCSRVTAFRDGRSVAEMTDDEITRPNLMQAIVGCAVEQLSATRKDTSGRPIILSVRGLTKAPRVLNVSFDLHEGEVLGLGGLVGAGRSELVSLIYGADRPDSGVMQLGKADFRPASPRQARKAGLGLVPEERRAEALVLSKSIAFNAQLSSLANLVFAPGIPLIDFSKRRKAVEKIVSDLSIKTTSIDTPVGQLSGGNQQKVVIGRWLMQAPKILIMDEPTRGVDIGARAEIHRLIRQLAEQGVSVLVVSSEPDELPDLCDRVLIMNEGRITSELAGEAITRNAIVEASYRAGQEQESLA